ncbi:MAG: heme exporter protein CcmD [Devosia sp.]
MIELGPHAVFIVSAYVGVAAVAAAMIAWVAWNSANVKRRLAALEAQGVRRRSDGQAT